MRVAVPLLAVVVVAGCGGDGDRLSKGEFVRRADTICARYEQRVQTAMRGVPAGNETELARAIERVLPVIRSGNDELRALNPPEALQERFDRWMGIADAEVTAAQKLRDALRDKDQQATQAAFRELQARDEDQDRLARRELGLTGCASGSSG